MQMKLRSHSPGGKYFFIINQDLKFKSFHDYEIIFIRKYFILMKFFNVNLKLVELQYEY